MIGALFCLIYEEKLTDDRKDSFVYSPEQNGELKNTDFYDEEKDGTAALV